MTTPELRALLAARGVALERTGDPTWTGSDCALMRADGELTDALLYGSAPVLPALLDRLERMGRLLRGLEWRETDRDDDFFCVRCGERKSDGHAPDCELAALLRSG